MIGTAGNDQRHKAIGIAPELSARKTFTGSQLAVFFLIGVLMLQSLLTRPEITIVIVSILFSVFYFAVVIFRAIALAHYREPPSGVHGMLQSTPKVRSGGEYVIMVALYREAGEVGALIGALAALKWPGKKSVYLICEEDDPETRAAIRTHPLPPGFFLVIVPEGLPKTKPRALNYCLRFVQGDYLVIYDAEDRPDPDQLLEAAARFESGPKKLACLQAPLCIDNANETMLTRLYAIEFRTLFFGILPALARWNAPMPLGGTSNHFRFDCLTECGGWDAYNVTEDADLGIRLARNGLQCGTLELATWEEAPARLPMWVRQRTRWIKGWMQTLLVHMRDPLLTIEEMGLRKFLLFHLVLTSVVISVLVHPFFLLAFVLQLWRYFSQLPASTYDLWMTGVSTFNLVAGYTTYGFLAWTIADQGRHKVVKWWVLLLPVYWLLISVAGWRAVCQLLFKPHVWEKTTHGLSKRQTPEQQCYPVED
jgi:cellulose synthase/poly-beta-1,6-N-acetylglucosamine synthase-like glycosyltransferase